MKKFVSALLTLALLFGLAVPTTAAAAEETVTIYANDTEKVIAENVKDGTNGYMENQGLYEETTGYYGLKPLDETLGAAKVFFSLDDLVAGQYEIVIAYAAKTGDAARKCDVYIDDTLSQQITFTCNADWETKSEYKFRVDLPAGDHDIVITTPSDYDNSSVKTPNIYAVKYTLKKAAEPVAETVTIWVGDDVAQDNELVVSENLFDPYQTNRLYEGHGCHGIKPADTSLPAKVTFSVDVETAGRYELVLLYAAKTGDAVRKVDVYVNDVLANNCTVTMQADWETVAQHRIFVNLQAGENDVTLTSSVDYDGSSVKNINIYGIKYTLKEAAKAPATNEEIVNALYALGNKENLDGEFTLTGVIDSFKYTYSPNYSTIQLTIIVDGMTDKPVVCYKLGGEGIDKVEVGDTITVSTKRLTNYNGTYELNGSTLVSYEKAVVAPQKGILGRVNSYDWSATGYANTVFSFVSSDETATASTILGQPVGTFAWWYAFVLEYNEDNGTFVVTVADTLMDGVNAIETATLGYGKIAFMFHDGFKDTDADTFNYFLEKATVGTEFYLVGDYDVMGATWDVIADTYLTTEKPESYWTKPVATPDEPVIEGDEYVVQKGDTLSKIAKACGLTVKELAEANDIENPNLIRKGATLIIPKVEVKRHIVVKGDTLGKIAKTYGCTVSELVDLNKIENPNLIIRGQVIVLP